MHTFDGMTWNRDPSDAYLLCESYYADSKGICQLGYQVKVGF